MLSDEESGGKMPQQQHRNMSLLQAVQSASLAAENGCRVVEEERNSVGVYDCHIWKKENTALLLFMKPNAEITVSSSINSLSGFKLIISEPVRQKFFLRCVVAMFSIVAFVLLFCSYQEHVFPWLSKEILILLPRAFHDGL
jgi:hypothetical protein